MVSDFNETKVLQAIKNLYADWLDDNYVNDQKVNEEFMRGYERKNLTSRLAALFNEVIKKDEI